MIHIVDPRQKRLFDPFEGVIPPAGQRIIGSGWQGVFRHVLLELMPVGELAENFSRELGAPTKELYSMAGLVFLADFFDWTAQEATEAYIFRSDVQYALNLEPGVEVSSRTIERYQKLFREDELATQVFQDVTIGLAEKLEIDITRQRLDSTHVFSHMASFGRTKLMAVAIKRFLTQVIRHAPEQFAALPAEFRKRYQPAESQLFAGAKDAEARQRCRQQAAEDLFWIIEHFADCPDMTARSSYKALVTIFGQQCELSAGKVVVKAKTGGDCVQNPSDPDASYAQVIDLDCDSFGFQVAKPFRFDNVVPVTFSTTLYEYGTLPVWAGFLRDDKLITMHYLVWPNRPYSWEHISTFQETWTKLP